MQARRRISAAFKDIPGGQVLGPTFDYSHRLLEPLEEPEPARLADTTPTGMPKVLDLLGAEGFIEAPLRESDEPGDITQEPAQFPMPRDQRLQSLARGDEGFLLSLAYSTQRGYGRTHPFAGEIRLGEVEIEFASEELGFSVTIGEITVTECEMINQFKGGGAVAPQFTRGYGLAFGHCERKAMAMALVDRALRADEFGEERTAPAQDEEFVIAHADNVQATGFVEHLKLPHYVDFQAELVLLRKLRAQTEQIREAAE
jgi:alpha-D-ribose 1-methylphosphonate 5-triphosphate synthase subunit PhnI